ncbi:MAG: Crp/Fnr family transcriptional regulator [Paracoccaceae bacterium]|nr:Crp/Fnr family transcriptional regulator [Paracoccaceae bacterium]
MNQRTLDEFAYEGAFWSCGACGAGPTCLAAFADPKIDVRRVHELDRADRLGACAASNGCLRFWTVVEGWAASCIMLADGRRQIISLEGVGSVICAGMTLEGSESWLEALTEARICEIDLSRQAKALRQNPEFLNRVFAITHARLARSEAHLSTLGRLDSQERVMLFLAEMAHAMPGRIVSLPMSREDIADYLGLNSETVSRILTRLKKSGLVKFMSPSDYTVPNMPALEDRLPVTLNKGGERMHA